MPTCTLAIYRLIWCNPCSTTLARRLPWAARVSMRVRRTRTSAYSAATKKAFTSTRATTIPTPHTISDALSITPLFLRHARRAVALLRLLRCCACRACPRGMRASSAVCFRVTLSRYHGDHSRSTAAEVSPSRSAVGGRLVHDASPAGRGHVRSLHGSTETEIERRHDQHVEHHRRQQAT